MTVIILAVVIATIAIAVTLFMNLNPRFGKGLTKEQKKEFESYPNFNNGTFQNLSTTKMDMHFFSLMKEYMKTDHNRTPKENITIQTLDSAFFRTKPQRARITWFGHSTLLLEIDTKNILLDPVFSSRTSPLSFIGAKRYNEHLPINIEELPQLDAVIISHDHYDHLDYESIIKLKDKTRRFITTLGVGNHLKRWGVDNKKIYEANWWDTISFDSLTLVCTPARHFSGRGLVRDKTLWSSWVIKGEQDNIFFSGDSGYDTHFKTIGEKYGPFDISLVECGQYHTNWQQIHMMPEETAQAAVDLRSKLALPIHWGAFTLALHDWTDPIERVTEKAKELNLQMTTPMIGESVILGSEIYPTSKWWKE